MSIDIGKELFSEFLFIWKGVNVKVLTCGDYSVPMARAA